MLEGKTESVTHLYQVEETARSEMCIVVVRQYGILSRLFFVYIDRLSDILKITETACN